LVSRDDLQGFCGHCGNCKNRRFCLSNSCSFALELLSGGFQGPPRPRYSSRDSAWACYGPWLQGLPRFYASCARQFTMPCRTKTGLKVGSLPLSLNLEYARAGPAKGERGSGKGESEKEESQNGSGAERRVLFRPANLWDPHRGAIGRRTLIISRAGFTAFQTSVVQVQVNDDGP